MMMKSLVEQNILKIETESNKSNHHNHGADRSRPLFLPGV